MNFRDFVLMSATSSLLCPSRELGCGSALSGWIRLSAVHGEAEPAAIQASGQIPTLKIGTPVGPGPALFHQWTVGFSLLLD